MLLVAIACAAAAYFVANWIGDTLIEKVYLDQKAMQKRERAIVSELQTYVQENRISSRDTDAVARWSMSKERYLCDALPEPAAGLRGRLVGRG